MRIRRAVADLALSGDVGHLHPGAGQPAGGVFRRFRHLRGPGGYGAARSSALFGIARVRRVIAGFGFLTAWSLLILAMIRVYSGAGWAGDWLEHFQRSLFFLQRFPVHTPSIPATNFRRVRH